jgi:hypothetical protein
MVILTPFKIEALIITQNPPIKHPITNNTAPIPNTRPFFAFTDSAMVATVLQAGGQP